jgi:hypothetical protein
MSFKLSLNIFKSTKPNSKLDFSGMLSIKPAELDALCRFVMSQTPDQYGTVQMPISGLKKVSEKVGPYIGAWAQPPMDWVDPGDAAQKLAAATDGVVSEITEADLF